MKPITRAWLESAYDDIRAMEQMLDLADLTNIVAFHAQLSHPPIRVIAKSQKQANRQ